MSHAYISERMFRTTYSLAIGLRDLRTRLPQAFDEGFGTISANELEELSFDLGQRFRTLTGSLEAVRPTGEGWAQASVALMADEELARCAKEILDIEAITDDLIEARKAAK